VQHNVICIESMVNLQTTYNKMYTDRMYSLRHCWPNSHSYTNVNEPFKRST